MARVHHVKNARKTKRSLGIVRGQPYWYIWRRPKGSRSRGTKVVFLKAPRPSQTAGSAFMRAFLAIQEGVELDGADVNDAADELKELAQEQRDKRENMPEHLQDSETGEMLEARAEACERIAEELGEVDFVGDDDPDREDDGEHQDKLRAEALEQVDWSID